MKYRGIDATCFFRIFCVLNILLATAAIPAAAADLEVNKPWVRATVPGQQTGAAYMQLSSRAGVSIVGVSSTLAGAAEFHAMSLEGGVMKMRGLSRLDVPPGKALTLSPGGYHLMLMELRQPLRPGATVPIVLQVKGSDGKVETVGVSAEVRDFGNAPPSDEHHHHH
ncbi:MAG: copper chaperone PCu(A)C [Proteobacteria bacterium]|nr:copper chaperone PCu(A)C [Pseudomonadota bacterium]HQR04876.1 copper chaperone PCu(A)C [Rhodocyclaceae bacterium]